MRATAAAAVAAATVAPPTKVREKTHHQDREGFRARPGYVYRLPGTKTIWLKRFGIEMKKAFSDVVVSGSHTWAEMQLMGDAEAAALATLRQHRVTYLADDDGGL